MPSLLTLSMAAPSLLPALLLLFVLLHAGVAGGSPLREHRLHGGDPEPWRGGQSLPPNTDMLKALEYIESLRQSTGAARQPGSHDPDALRSHAQTSRDQAGDEEEDDEEESQQWLRAVLKTLQKPQTLPKAPERPAFGERRRPASDRDQGRGEDVTDGYGAYPWMRRPRGPHRKYPLMFEDEEGGPSQESLYKRNEKAEKQYTPQSLATLQSVFQELGRLAPPPNGHQRRRSTTPELLDEQDEEGEEDEDDLFRVRNVAYEDEEGGDDWTPVGNGGTDEEEDGLNEFDRGLDETEDEGDEEDEEEEEKVDVRRSREEADDITRLVDSYLLKVLEKTEQEEQRGERSADPQYGVDPQAIYQLMRISQRLQVPPEELLEAMKSKGAGKQDKSPGVKQATSWGPEDDARHRASPRDDVATEDFLNILGLASEGTSTTDRYRKRRPSQTSSSGRDEPKSQQGAYIYSKTAEPEKRTPDFDDTEDQLANYLATRVPSYPEETEQKREGGYDSRRPLLGALEQAVPGYFDQLDANRGQSKKRHSEDSGKSVETPGLEDDALLKILDYLNPEAEEGELKDLYDKPMRGM